jgi:hypothetical protein
VNKEDDVDMTTLLKPVSMVKIAVLGLKKIPATSYLNPAGNECDAVRANFQRSRFVSDG